MKTSDDGKYSQFDDYLGNADTQFGHKKEQHEDRVFSSSTGLNAILDIWTIGETDLSWVKDTPDSIKSAAERLTAFLVEKGDD